MKIKLLKDWKKDNGLVIKTGRVFSVTNELGKQLIKKETAEQYKPGTIKTLFGKKKERNQPEEDKGE